MVGRMKAQHSGSDKKPSPFVIAAIVAGGVSALIFGMDDLLNVKPIAKDQIFQIQVVDPPQISAGLEQCPQGHPLSVNGQDRRLARGFNFPNWDPDHSGLNPTDAMLSELYGKGFTHIRLPINAEKTMAVFTAPNKIADYMDALDHMVKRLTRLGFAVTIDMHPSAGPLSELYQSRPDLAFGVLKDGWALLTESAKEWPLDLVYFELLNEPIKHDEWWQAAQILVDHLNIVAPGRKLIVGPGVWQRYEPLIASSPLKGDNLIYAIHEYSPMVFTHQSMTWDEGSPLARLKHVPFPASINHPAIQKQLAYLQKIGDEAAAAELRQAFQRPWDAARLRAMFREVGQWASDHDVTVILNEFGVLNFAVSETHRANWLKAVREAAHDVCIGTTVWDYSDGFGIVDGKTGKPYDTVMDALLYSVSR